MKLAEGLGRRRLWAGFAAVLIPLAILLVVQYRWLVKLDQTSAKAHQAALDNYLEAVTAGVENSYREKAERLLNVSPWIFTLGPLEKAAYHFKSKSVEGARRLFVMSFPADTDEPSLLFFEPSCATWSKPKPNSPEARAIVVATASWRMLAYKREAVERAPLTVDERNSKLRIVFNPIIDDSSRIVGIAGMILDPSFFQWKILPQEVQKSVPSFSEDPRYDPVVTVWDGKGHVAFATGPTADRPRSSLMPAALRTRPEPGGPEAEKAFSFVFTDWRIGLTSRHATPAQVARRNFVLNFALSIALSTVLLAGIVLALRTASREMNLSQMKNDFVSNVSHELRTPLASIRVFGELLRLGRVDNPEKVREYGEYIETESRRLTQLINNILDFARIESGRKSYRFEPVCIEEVVAETLKTFDVRLRQNGFHIDYQGPEEPLPPVALDAGAIAQSLSNLLDNAVKYSNGGREIQVTVRRDASENGWVVISVRDQGIGIPRDEQEKIFDRFHRVSTGLVHDVKGSGLGLSIVRHIVEAHHGRVTVESRVGEGSTFSIRLPLETAEP